MEKSGPQLETLTHRLAECPPEFHQFPIRSGPGTSGDSRAIDLAAVVCDHYRDLQVDLAGVRPVVDQLASVDAAHQTFIAIAIWLLRDEWFMSRRELADDIGRFLLEGLRPLSATIKPELVIADADRREELARLCLSELGYRPAGETKEQAQDRLNTLDSVERGRVVRKTRAAEARARKIREEMARQRAQEAAARYAPE